MSQIGKASPLFFSNENVYDFVRYLAKVAQAEIDAQNINQKL